MLSLEHRVLKNTSRPPQPELESVRNSRGRIEKNCISQRSTMDAFCRPLSNRTNTAQTLQNIFSFIGIQRLFLFFFFLHIFIRLRFPMLRPVVTLVFYIQTDSR